MPEDVQLLPTDVTVPYDSRDTDMEQHGTGRHFAGRRRARP